MGIIQCAENCKYQCDGYCTLNKCTAVNSLSGVCPYLQPKEEALSAAGKLVEELALRHEEPAQTKAGNFKEEQP